MFELGSTALVFLALQMRLPPSSHSLARDVILRKLRIRKRGSMKEVGRACERTAPSGDPQHIGGARG